MVFLKIRYLFLPFSKLVLFIIMAPPYCLMNMEIRLVLPVTFCITSGEGSKLSPLRIWSLSVFGELLGNITNSIKVSSNQRRAFRSRQKSPASNFVNLWLAINMSNLSWTSLAERFWRLGAAKNENYCKETESRELLHNDCIQEKWIVSQKQWLCNELRKSYGLRFESKIRGFGKKTRIILSLYADHLDELKSCQTCTR